MADLRRQPDIAIAERRAAFADALRRHDTRAAGSAYADTARLLAPSAELIEGRGGIEAFWQAGLDAGLVDVELEAVAVERRDGIAYEIGRYALLLQPVTGGNVVDRGKYVLVLEQQDDGSWRRAVEMFNPETPSAVPFGSPPVR